MSFLSTQRVFVPVCQAVNSQYPLVLLQQAMFYSRACGALCTFITPALHTVNYKCNILQVFEGWGFSRTHIFYIKKAVKSQFMRNMLDKYPVHGFMNVQHLKYHTENKDTQSANYNDEHQTNNIITKLKCDKCSMLLETGDQMTEM